ncbi:uncharacterized protein LOC114840419 isoform X3 [Esox lucius]|uniref:Fibronectin type-III domain-containing protein n=1 Tax=Esox lucius TaxID=8010 RepID=A0AAY5KL20_ESOLU|nr:uncharacterized protein LOC114840419 isoform X3 [Esox lucius]
MTFIKHEKIRNYVFSESYWALELTMELTTMSNGNLQCFNDYDKSMVCLLTTESNCSGYNLELILDEKKIRFKELCAFEDKESSSVVSKCSCSIKNMTLIIGEVFIANLSHSGKQLTSGKIYIKDSIKPKAPTIQEVIITENKNIWVKWKTNYKDIPSKNFIAEMSYSKKGQTDGLSLNISSTSHEILGSDLEPNTVYALKIRTYSDFSNRFSDWSEDLEFNSPPSSQGVFNVVIVLICIIVVIITTALFWCVVRLKAKWWDNIPKCSNSVIGHMVPGVPKVLDAPKLLISPIHLDSSEVDQTEGKSWTKSFMEDGSSGGHQQGSCSELDSSSLGYAHVDPTSPALNNVQIISLCQEALRQVFPNLDNSYGNSKKPFVLDPPVNAVSLMKDSGGSSCYNNLTYSSTAAPSSLEESEPSKTFPFSTQPCHVDISHHAPQMCLGTGQPGLHLSTNGTPALLTDFSYKLSDCSDVDSKTTRSAEDTCLTFGSDDSNVSAPLSRISVVTRNQRFSEAVCKGSVRGTDATMDMPLLPTGLQDVDSGETLIYDMNPCYHSTQVPGCSLAPSDDSYQALQSLGPNSLDPVIAGQSADQGRHVNMSEVPHTSAGNTPLHFLPNSQGGQCLTLGSPFLTAFCTDQAMQVQCDSSYHCL